MLPGPPFRPLISWKPPEGVAHFRELVEEILSCYKAAPDADDVGQLPDTADLTRLIEHTIKFLGSVGPNPIPEEHYGAVFVAAAHLQGAWANIEARWKMGDLSDMGAALGRTRLKGWNKSAYKKHREMRPLIFAEICCEISSGESRAGAVEKIVRKYSVSKTQVDTLSGACFRALASKVDFSTVLSQFTDTYEHRGESLVRFEHLFLAPHCGVL